MSLINLRVPVECWCKYSRVQCVHKQYKHLDSLGVGSHNIIFNSVPKLLHIRRFAILLQYKSILSSGKDGSAAIIVFWCRLMDYTIGQDSKRCRCVYPRQPQHFFFLAAVNVVQFRFLLKYARLWFSIVGNSSNYVNFLHHATQLFVTVKCLIWYLQGLRSV